MGPYKGPMTWPQRQKNGGPEALRGQIWPTNTKTAYNFKNQGLHSSKPISNQWVHLRDPWPDLRGQKNRGPEAQRGKIWHPNTKAAEVKFDILGPQDLRFFGLWGQVIGPLDGPIGQM